MTRLYLKYKSVILKEKRLCQFISSDAYGICVRVFCDFGEAFEVSDPTGEEPKEIFIQSITQVVILPL